MTCASCGAVVPPIDLWATMGGAMHEPRDKCPPCFRAAVKSAPRYGANTPGGEPDAFGEFDRGGMVPQKKRPDGMSYFRYGKSWSNA